jgi:glutathione S-transferase
MYWTISSLSDLISSPCFNTGKRLANFLKSTGGRAIDIFSKFSYFIKQVSHSADHLLKELQAINDYLETANTRYLCGDKLTHLDCLMLPKLQHIRVAAKAFKEFHLHASIQASDWLTS